MERLQKPSSDFGSPADRSSEIRNLSSAAQAALDVWSDYLDHNPRGMDIGLMPFVVYLKHQKAELGEVYNWTQERDTGREVLEDYVNLIKLHSEGEPIDGVCDIVAFRYVELERPAPTDSHFVVEPENEQPQSSLVRQIIHSCELTPG